MSYQTAKTIKSVIDEIESNNYLLPAIQREFVWKSSQIEMLFDSLLSGYPINSFLFWRVKGDKTQEYEFYKFLDSYSQFDNRHNKKIDTLGREEITAILDGQQRLTSLYIALKGTYAYKLPWKRYDNPESYPKRKLYVDLINKSNKVDMTYDFRFLTEQEVLNPEQDKKWFRVGDILSFTSSHEVTMYIMKNLYGLENQKQSMLATEILSNLYHVINEKGTISYYLEESQELEKVLNIFIRINSGGSVLSYSDLLLSIATAQWENYDAREEIIDFVNEINYIGDGFNFNKDFVLKSCLVLSDIQDIGFKVDNFNKKNMSIIESQWRSIQKSIRIAVELMASFGYSRETLTSNNAIIPICYYIKKNHINTNFIESSKYTKERQGIKKFLLRSLLKKIFGAHPDNQLRIIRNTINESEDKFPLEEIKDKFKGRTYSITFTEEDIENLMGNKYGGALTFSTLQVLYPNLDYRNKFHVDHIYPKSLFTKRKLMNLGIESEEIDFYMGKVNYIANLQLLEGQRNIEKRDKHFEDWIENSFTNRDDKIRYIENNYIPDIDFNITNFKEFFFMRQDNIKQRLKQVLS